MTNNKLIDFLVNNINDLKFLFKFKKIINDEEKEEEFFVPPKIGILILLSYVETLAVIYQLYLHGKGSSNKKEQFDNCVKAFLCHKKNRRNSKFHKILSHKTFIAELYSLRCTSVHFSGLNKNNKIIYTTKVKVSYVRHQRMLESRGYLILFIEDFKDLIIESYNLFLMQLKTDLESAISNDENAKFQQRFNKIYEKFEDEGSVAVDDLLEIK